MGVRCDVLHLINRTIHGSRVRTSSAPGWQWWGFRHCL